MKYTITILLLLPLIAFGQKTYAPLNTIWNYEGHEIDCLGNHKTYKVEQEVMIDGKDCSIIYSYGGNFPNSDRDSLVVWENDNRVYFLEDTIFYLMYDFDVAIGDTVTYYSPIDKGEFSSYYEPNDTLTTPPRTSFLIEDITEINVNAQPHKVFHTESIIDPLFTDRDYLNTMSSYLENIGSLDQRLTGEIGFFVADGCFGGLQCYNNGDVEYVTDRMFTTPHPDCPLPLDATEDLVNDVSVTIYPNPTSDILNIESEKPFEGIQVYEINERKVLNARTENRLNTSMLSKGIYLLELRFDSGLHYSRFVK